MSEANKAIVRRLIDEVLNGGRLELVHELYAPALASAAQRWIAPFRASFPDVEMEVIDLIAEGDKVVGRFTCSATHKGTWRGHAATGRRFEHIDEVSIFRLREGRIVSVWSLEDTLARMEQLGLGLGAQYLAPIVELCQTGKLATVIDRRYRLSEVPEALRYLGEGHAKGKVVVIVADATTSALMRRNGGRVATGFLLRQPYRCEAPLGMSITGPYGVIGRTRGVGRAAMAENTPPAGVGTSTSPEPAGVEQSKRRNLGNDRSTGRSQGCRWRHPSIGAGVRGSAGYPAAACAHPHETARPYGVTRAG